MVISPRGEADLCTVKDLAQTLCDAIAADRVRMILDLDQLTFMDAATVGTLVAARRRASEAGKTLTVRCTTPHKRVLLAITGLEALLDEST